MRELFKLRTLRLAGPVGVVVALACTPYILHASEPGLLRVMQLVALPPISIVLLQISIAWTPHRRPYEVLACFGSPRSGVTLAGLGVLLSCGAMVLLDPFIGRVLPRYFPASPWLLVLSLPWIALFQPLFLVASVYAFACRLTRRPLWAVAAVILAHQGILLLQVKGMSTGLVPGLLLAAGLYGLVLAWSYHAHGLCGPAVIALLSQARHALRFL